MFFYQKIGVLQLLQVVEKASWLGRPTEFPFDMLVTANEII